MYVCMYGTVFTIFYGVLGLSGWQVDTARAKQTGRLGGTSLKATKNL